MAYRIEIIMTVLACLGVARAAEPTGTAASQPDLSGYWTNTTVTPLERPKELADKAFFTPEEAAEYAKRQLAVPEATGPGTYADMHYNYGPVWPGEEPNQGGGQRSNVAHRRSARWPDSSRDAGGS